MLQVISWSPAEVRRKFPQWQTCIVIPIISGLTTSPKISDMVHYQTNTNIQHVLTLMHKHVHIKKLDRQGSECWSECPSVRWDHNGPKETHFHLVCFAHRSFSSWLCQMYWWVFFQYLLSSDVHICLCELNLQK